MYCTFYLLQRSIRPSSKESRTIYLLLSYPYSKSISFYPHSPVGLAIENDAKVSSSRRLLRVSSLGDE